MGRQSLQKYSIFSIVISDEHTIMAVLGVIVGMGAVVSATSHGPLSAIFILFEITGYYKIILPLMITCIISCLIGGRLLKESIYIYKLSRRGVDIRGGKEVNVLKSIPVKDVMNPEVETIPESLKLGELAEKTSESRYNSFPVVNNKSELTGVLSFRDYHMVLFDENLKDLVLSKDIANQDVVTMSVDDDLYNALEKITLGDFSILPVMSSNNPSQLLGILTCKDVLDAYNTDVSEIL